VRRQAFRAEFTRVAIGAAALTSATAQTVISVIALGVLETAAAKAPTGSARPVGRTYGAPY
jgi:hypothetical protein